MATEVGSAYVTLIPSAKGFASSMQKQLGPEVATAGTKMGNDLGDKTSKSMGSRMKSGAKSIFSGLAVAAGPIAAAAAGAAIGKVLWTSIAEARDAEKITARTEGVIKSMGNQAGVSAKQVADLAGELSNKAGIDDEEIQAGQNMLLTFGAVRNEVGKGNDVFNQASGLMTDLSAGMGTSMKGAAIQLGKALQDPIKGTSALGRAGVQFTDDQKAAIKTMMENGDTLGAQKIILGEVGKQFKGAAAQMATPADKAKVAWGNFQESIGTALLPVVDKVLTAFAKALPVVLEFAGVIGEKIGPVIADVIEWFKSFGGEVGGNETKMKEWVKLLEDVWTTVQELISGIMELITLAWSAFGDDILAYLRPALDNVKKIIGGAMKIIRGVIDLVLGILTGDWARAWDGIKSILSGAWDIIVGVIKQALNLAKLLIVVAWKIIVGIFKRAWSLIKLAVGAGIKGIVALVKKLPGWLVAGLKALGRLLKFVFTKAWDFAKKAVSNALTNIVDAVKKLPSKLGALGGLLKNAGKKLLEMLLDGLKAGAGFAGDLAQKVWDAIKSFINDGIVELNELLEFTLKIGPKSFTVDPPDIPTLASGGRATSATLALIGEGAEPETVLPDSMLRGLLERAAAGGSGGGQIAQLTITNWHEGKGFIRMVADESVGDDASFRRDLGVMHA